MSCQVAALIIAVRLAGFAAGPGKVTQVDLWWPSNRYQALAKGHGPRLPADRLHQYGKYSQLDILAEREIGRAAAVGVRDGERGQPVSRPRDQHYRAGMTTGPGHRE
jgi:hypothetical protein